MSNAGVDAKERILAEARHKLAFVDDTVEKKRMLLRKVDEAHTALLAGNAVYNEALATIAGADAEDSLVNLSAEARRTQTNEDEALVGRLEAIDARMANTVREIANLRRSAIDLSRRRSEMEEVRGKFRRRGYDHSQSTFDNEGDIGSVLGRVLEGTVRSGVLWDMLRQGHRSRPTRGGADFGAPSFPFPFPLPGGLSDDTRGGGWRDDPSSRGGWVPSPSGAGSDDQNFSTGGTF